MPRVPAVSKPAAAVSLVRGAGRNGAKAVPPPRAVGQEQQPSRHEDEKETCPLCVEVLDATDIAKQPCPCGYLVCLFCLEKLKLHKYPCPNCRRGYDSEEAKEYAKQLEAERAQEALRPKASTAPAPAASTSSAAAVASRPPAKVAPTLATARRDTGPLPAAKRNSGAIDDGGSHSSGPGLPTGAAWASASPSTLSRNQSVEIERPAINMDESSWPSLGAPAQPPQPAQRQHAAASHHHAQQVQQLQHQQQQSSCGSASAGKDASSSPTRQAQHQAHVQQQQQQQQHRHSPSAGSEMLHSCDQSGPATRRSSSVASSMDRVESSSSLELMSQDPPVTPEQLLQLQHQHQQYQAQAAQAASLVSGYSGLAPPLPPPGFEASSSYYTAQVHTTINGLRRSVNVPLALGGSAGGGAVEPYPEAPALLTSLQQGVAARTVTPKDGAAQLFGLLRAKEQEAQGAGRLRSSMAATKPPPGFAAPAAVPVAAAQPSAVTPPLAAARPPPPPGFGHVAPAAQPSRPAAPSSSQAGGDSGFGAGAGLIGLNANGTPRTYSMWSGLPGMELAGATGLSSLWQNLNASSLSLGGASQPYNPLGLVEQSLAYASRPPAAAAAPKAPPPGFGPSAYGGAQQPALAAAPPQQQQQQLGTGDAVLGGNFRGLTSFQPVGGARYNPLNQPVMPGAYRPPLGAGL